MRYKGQYRLKCEYDATINQFPRKLDGTYEDIDVYIDCLKNVRVYSYGHGVLQVYIPSIGRGNNIIKDVVEKYGDNIIFDIEKTDTEVLFKFKAKDMNKLEEYLKPKTGGSNISPFSNKNLPKNKTYKIPDEELESYKNIVAKIPTERILTLSHMTNNFLKTLATKKNTWEDIKSDMALKGLNGKNYIHSIGKWKSYLNYLEEHLCSN